VRLDFFTRTKFIGSAFIGSDGRAIFEVKVKQNAIETIEPGSLKRLRPTDKDGERYLRALPVEFRTPYLMTRIVEDEEIKKAKDEPNTMLISEVQDPLETVAETMRMMGRDADVEDLRGKTLEELREEVAELEAIRLAKAARRAI
jgi:hypothetical protein